MSARAFFTDEAKRRVRMAIERIEAKTSAEVVVTVRRRVARYRAVDLAVGCACGVSALVWLLFSEREFSPVWMPVDVALMFLLGWFVSAQTPTLQRCFVSSVRRRALAAREARVAFYDLGVSRTKDRNGLLVLVAVFERQVQVVCDVGLHTRALGEPFWAAVRTLEAAIAKVDPKLDEFVSALEALGEVLAEPMPRQADDVNELPDEVV